MPLDARRWTAIGTYADPYWNRVKHGVNWSDVPAQTQFLLWEREGGGFGVLLPLLSGDHVNSLLGDPEGVRLIAGQRPQEQLRDTRRHRLRRDGFRYLHAGRALGEGDHGGDEIVPAPRGKEGAGLRRSPRLVLLGRVLFDGGRAQIPFRHGLVPEGRRDAGALSFWTMAGSKTGAISCAVST